MILTQCYVRALAYNLAIRTAYEYWRAYIKINPNKEYGGETDEAFKDNSEIPLFENFFEKGELNNDRHQPKLVLDS